MADDPFRLRVLRDGVTATLKTITPTNGYINDLSDFDPGDGETAERVFRGRAWFGEGDPIPMVSVLEAPDPSDDFLDVPFDGKQDGGEWRLFVQGFVDNDPTHPTDAAYVLLADVRRRLLVEGRRKHPVAQHQPDPFGMGVVSSGGSGNAVLEITVGAGVVRPADDLSARSYFWLILTVRLVEDGETPYA